MIFSLDTLAYGGSVLRAALSLSDLTAERLSKSMTRTTEKQQVGMHLEVRCQLSLNAAYDDVVSPQPAWQRSTKKSRQAEYRTSARKRGWLHTMMSMTRTTEDADNPELQIGATYLLAACSLRAFLLLVNVCVRTILGLA